MQCLLFVIPSFFDVILEDVKSSSLNCTGKAEDFHERGGGELGKMEYLIGVWDFIGEAVLF